MLCPVDMQLLCDLVPTQMVFRPIIVQRVIMIFGAYYDLYARRLEPGWIGWDTE